MANDIDQDEVPIEIPTSGSVADRINYCEQLENKLLGDLYNAGSVEEQEPIKTKMDYLAGVIERLEESRQAVEHAGKAVTAHADGGFTPHDRIRALDILMEEAAATGDINTYKMHRTQRQELVRKYGAPGNIAVSSNRNPKLGDLKKIANSYQSDTCGADLETRMEAAAQAGDMTTYKELRTQRRDQMAQQRAEQLSNLQHGH